MQLTPQQKQLLFDYSVGLTSEEQTEEAKKLISSSAEAAESFAKLKSVLAPLDSLEPEVCPDDLVESTIVRLNNAARSSQLRLEQLLADEQVRNIPVKSQIWLNIGRRLAMAAVFIIVGSAAISMINYSRQRYWQTQCKRQLARVSQGINNYSADNNGRLPAMAASAGTPYWKVGDQGKENYSNTRPIWLLAKNGYVKNPADFVCPGNKQGRALQFDALDVNKFNDFPDRKYITFSLRINCDKQKDVDTLGRSVLMADLSPLFERLPEDYSKEFKLELSKAMRSINSINHNRRGQNVLFCDGSVEFTKKRHTSISEDDIFTLQGVNTYQGVEVPSCETDTFLAP